MIEDSFIFRNGAELVGAISVGSGTSGTLRRTSFNNNSGLLSALTTRGRVLIEDSAIYNNTGPLDVGEGAINNAGELTIVSSTIARNRLLGIKNSGSLILTNATVTGNTSSVFVTPAAGIQNTGTGTVQLQNTIVALNTGLNSVPADCNNFTSLGNYLIGSLNGCTVELSPTDIVGDPALGAFSVDDFVAGSGHFPLLSTSRAIDSADDSSCPLVMRRADAGLKTQTPPGLNQTS